MAKTLTSLAQTKTTQQYGTEPIIVVKIDWVISGTKWYAYKAFTLPGIIVQSILMNDMSMSGQTKDFQTGSFNTATIDLLDTNGDLKVLYDSQTIEKTPVTIYLYYEGFALSDFIKLFEGQLSGNIIWSEGERTLSFEAESIIEDAETGFSVDDASIIPGMPEELEGTPWPLAFGSNVHAKALHLVKRQTGTLATVATQQSTILTINGGSEFSQDQTIDIQIRHVVYRGRFSGDIFTVEDVPVPNYENVPIATRDVSDTDYENASVLWIDRDISIFNYYVTIVTGTGVRIINRCVRQEGRKCYFFNTWDDGVSNEVLHSSGFINQVSRVKLNNWDIEKFIDLDNVAFHYIWSLVPGTSDARWLFTKGTEVRLWSETPDTYIVNIIPNSTIKSVYGTRQNRDGREEFVPIPSQLYVKKESLSIGNTTVTAIQFTTPLIDLLGHDWSGDVYVTFISPIGPNTADIIEWIVENYSSLSVDSTTFNAVSTKLDNYPSHFVLNDKRSTIELVEDIAWQARCVLSFETGVVKIIYISEQPSAQVTVTKSLVENRTLTSNHTDITGVITKLKGKWQSNAKDTPPFPEVRQENISKYGLRESEKEFFIYNIRNLVQKSLRFWAHRYANQWLNIKASSFSDLIKLDVFDGLNLSLSDTTIVPVSSVRAVLYGFEYQSGKYDFDLWLPIVSGSKAVDDDAWMDDSGDTLPADPTDGFEETTEWAFEPNHETRNTNPRGSSKEKDGKTYPGIVQQRLGVESATMQLYLVDIYKNGYDQSVTDQNVEAYADPRFDYYAQDDRVLVYMTKKKNFILKRNEDRIGTLCKVVSNDGNDMFTVVKTDVTLTSVWGDAFSALDISQSGPADGDPVLVFWNHEPGIDGHDAFFITGGGGSNVGTTTPQAVELTAESPGAVETEEASKIDHVHRLKNHGVGNVGKVFKIDSAGDVALGSDNAGSNNTSTVTPIAVELTAEAIGDSAEAATANHKHRLKNQGAGNVGKVFKIDSAGNVALGSDNAGANVTTTVTPLPVELTAEAIGNSAEAAAANHKHRLKNQGTGAYRKGFRINSSGDVVVDFERGV